MGISSLKGSLETQAGLIESLFQGQMQMVDQATKTAKVGMQMQLKAQEMATNQAVVAQMTGVGGQLNIKV